MTSRVPLPQHIFSHGVLPVPGFDRRPTAYHTLYASYFDSENTHVRRRHHRVTPASHGYYFYRPL
jgi:hypothetical protein